MVLLTMIARVADGLPLAASMQEDEQAGTFNSIRVRLSNSFES
uniref:SEC22 homolog B, vesicle trafficking protein n=1 Tax=Mus musculus TaxID=10090 RepID=D6RES2_MOUSE